MNAFPFSDILVLAIFIVFALTVVAGALIAVNTVRIIRSVCGLAMCCIGLAGLFYFLDSPFIALMEILIYVGAVCVTIIFAVMLAEPDEPTPDRLVKPYPVFGTLAALLTAFIIFCGVAKLSLSHVWPAAERLNDGSVKAIGIALLTTYSLPFELISLVLLVAILGALAIARGGRTKE
ncbi:MAG: NADH-quinone oxidoreductase subunit J [Opitutaceae bacterium]|jgi:NADH-quinone oxidoreductase subunit J